MYIDVPRIKCYSELIQCIIIGYSLDQIFYNRTQGYTEKALLTFYKEDILLLDNRIGVRINYDSSMRLVLSPSHIKNQLNYYPENRH